MVYRPFRITLSKNQLLKAVASKPVKVKHSQLGKGDVILLHPSTYKALMKAYEKGKGATFILAPGEIHATQMSDLDGTGIFDFFKKGFNWVKNNWGSIKKILTPVLDIGAPALASAFPTAGPAILAGRKIIKDTTGASIGANGLYLTAGKASGRGLYL